MILGEIVYPCEKSNVFDYFNSSPFCYQYNSATAAPRTMYAKKILPEMFIVTNQLKALLSLYLLYQTIMPKDKYKRWAGR